jgi:hypothetical protein
LGYPDADETVPPLGAAGGLVCGGLVWGGLVWGGLVWGGLVWGALVSAGPTEVGPGSVAIAGEDDWSPVMYPVSLAPASTGTGSPAVMTLPADPFGDVSITRCTTTRTTCTGCTG